MTPPEQETGQAPERPKRGARRQPPEPPVDPEKATKDLVPSSRKTIEEIQETESERESRLRIKEEDARVKREEEKAAMDHRRKVELVILIASLVISAIVCAASLKALFDKSIPTQDKAWAGPLLTLIVGGLAGFWTGRSSSRQTEK